MTYARIASMDRAGARVPAAHHCADKVCEAALDLGFDSLLAARCTLLVVGFVKLVLIDVGFAFAEPLGHHFITFN